MQTLFLLIGEVRASAEPLGADDDTGGACGDFERIVLYVFTGPAEDCVEQFFFRCQFGLGLGRNFADEDVAGTDAGADTDDAVLVEIAEHFFRDVGDVAGELFSAELGFTNLHIELVDVNARHGVFSNEAFGDDDGVFKVVAVESQEGDEGVFAQRQLAVLGRGAVRDDLTFFDLITEVHDGLLIEAGALVELGELAEFVFIGVADDDSFRIDVGDSACGFRANDHATVGADVLLHARRNDRRVNFDKRDRLPLHVRTHQRTVGVVMLEERNERCGNADDLLGRTVDILNLRGIHLGKFTIDPRENRAFFQLSVLIDRIARRENRLHLFVGAESDDFVGDFAVFHFAVRREQEAVLINGRVNTQRADQADVRAFRRFDRADSTIVGDVHVADFKACAFAVEPAWPKRGKPTLVDKARQGIRLIDDLREFRSTKEEVDCGTDRLGVDEISDLREFVRVLDAHALLHGSAELEETLAHLVDGKLVERAESAVAQMVDVIELRQRPAGDRVGTLAAKIEDVLHDAKEILSANEHHVLGDIEIELAVDAESANLAQAVSRLIAELLFEELAGFFNLRRIAGAQARVDFQQGCFVIACSNLVELFEIFLSDGVENQRI